jgi:hypothetical protein
MSGELSLGDGSHGQIASSTGTTAPVTYEAAAEHRNATTEATSCGCPRRPAGIRARTRAVASGSSSTPRASGVTTKPGATALTRMPSAAYSAASDFVSWDTPPLLAL